MPRQAKIAVFPESVREQVNLRLLDGQNPATILPWLNEAPELVSRGGITPETLAKVEEALDLI